jgi:hypothetical protein
MGRIQSLSKAGESKGSEVLQIRVKSKTGLATMSPQYWGTTAILMLPKLSVPISSYSFTTQKSAEISYLLVRW